MTRDNSQPGLTQRLLGSLWPPREKERPPEHQLLLSLCRAWLFDETPELPGAPVDWARMQQLILRSGLAGLLHEAIEQHRDQVQPPRQVLRALTVARLGLEARNRRLLEQTRILCTAARERGLTLVPTKGMALMMNRPYSGPDLRVSTDVDVIARRSEYGALERLIQEHGYVAGDNREVMLRHYYHVQFFKEVAGGRVMVELHWTPYYMMFGREPLEEPCFGRTVRHEHDGIEYQLLDPEDTLLALQLHMAMHRYRGQLKWAADIPAVLRHFEGRIDWQTVWDRARALGASRAVGFGLWSALALLGQDLASRPPGRQGLRWQLLRRLNPEAKQLESHDQPSPTTSALIDACGLDSLRQGLQHVLYKFTERHERVGGMRLPSWLVRGGLDRSG